MRDWLLEHLICPISRKPLVLRRATRSGLEILSGNLVSPDGHEYPIVNGIPRFVKKHYATAFGLQWNTHALTQIDTRQHNHSAKRFWGETGFRPEKIANALVLDGGCGSGRFTEVAASAGGRVVAVDISEAVEACYKNHRDRPDVAVVQASLLELPLARKTFDFVFTIGVIQHTPEPLKALYCVADCAKVGGEAGVSWYKKYWYTRLHQKYILRPFFDGWDEHRLYKFVCWYVPKLLPVSRFFGRVLPASILDRIFPVANRDWVDGLTVQEKLEWAILDTYDWFNPKYDLPQKWKDVESTMEKLGFRCERAPHRRDGLHCIRTADHA